MSCLWDERRIDPLSYRDLCRRLERLNDCDKRDRRMIAMLKGYGSLQFQGLVVIINRRIADRETGRQLLLAEMAKSGEIAA